MTEERITYYDILGVSPDATDEQIRTAYRRAQRHTHPDSTQSQTSHLFQMTQDAWYHLGDPERRAQYDASLRAGTTPSSAWSPPSTSTPPSAPTPPSPPQRMTRVPASALQPPIPSIKHVLANKTLDRETIVPRLFPRRWFIGLGVMTAAIWFMIGAALLGSEFFIPFLACFAFALIVCLRFAFTNAGRVGMTLFTIFLGTLGLIFLGSLISPVTRSGSWSVAVLIAANLGLTALAWGRRRNWMGKKDQGISMQDAYPPRWYGTMVDASVLNIADTVLAESDLDALSVSIGTHLTDRMLVELASIPGVSIFRSFSWSSEGRAFMIGHMVLCGDRAVLLDSHFVPGGYYTGVVSDNYLQLRNSHYGIRTALPLAVQTVATRSAARSDMHAKTVMGIAVLHSRDEEDVAANATPEAKGGNATGLKVMTPSDAIATAAAFLLEDHSALVDRHELKIFAEGRI